MNTDDALYAELFGGPIPGNSLPTGPDEPPPPTGAPAATVLGWALRTGRIVASSRSRWEEQATLDPDGTDATLRILYRPSIGPEVLQVSTVTGPRPATAARPVDAAAGASYTPRRQTASGLDVSPLPKRLQAAAARSTDRGAVVGWLERYTGEADEDVSPGALSMQGDHALAAEVARDEEEAALAARAEVQAQYTVNARVHLEQQAVELVEHQKRLAGS